jgi:tRNA threonylcarbamoyl adenosine modification protein (Sua5/YciO/YrdC/YwlC family)
MPRTVAADDPTAVDQAAAALVAGATVVVPTETVYGVATLPTAPGATEALFALKDRPDTVPLGVLVADQNQAAQLAVFSPVARRLAAAYWPGPLTLVLPRRAAAAALDLGGSPATVGVRCPADDLVRAIARRVGPIATTSANRHGQPTPATAREAAAALSSDVDLVIDGGRREGLPSTVVDCTGIDLVVLRHGAISDAALSGARASLVFDRVAGRYDETRGGLERGRRLADALRPWITGRRVLEVGVGTGAVAVGLVDRGVSPMGIDLSIEMLRRAAPRLGPTVAIGDAGALPVATGGVDTVIAVWVLHVVADADAALAEAARVLGPEGRLLVIEGAIEQTDDDMARAVGDLHERLRGGRQVADPDRTVARAAAAGFTLVEELRTPPSEFGDSPNDAADRLEQRVYSSLWELPEEVWAAHVEPVVSALRALPDPDRPRPQRVREPLLVFDRK